MGENQKRRGYRGEIVLWAFRGEICDHGICIEDCDKCNRVLPFKDESEEKDGEIDDEAGQGVFTNTRDFPGDDGCDPSGVY